MERHHIIFSRDLLFFLRIQLHQYAFQPVLRDGVRRVVRLAEIVPGDFIYLSADDIIPADARVISVNDLFVDQSALTGESFPVEKAAAPLKAYELTITEWGNYLFKGTSVVSRSATAVVVKTGGLTGCGKIAKRLVAREPETESQRGILSFGYMIMQVTFMLVIFVFFINALYMRSILDSLLFAAALAVGLTPELLPMIISVNLSKGAVSMAREDVIVKRLASHAEFRKHGCSLHGQNWNFNRKPYKACASRGS